jgi:hypothetical protein
MPSLINAIVATQASTRNSRIAGCSPANRDVVKVQPQESTQEITIFKMMPAGGKRC